MKRFYEAVAVAPSEGGYRVLLDGRGIKTVAGQAQVVPTRALAEALASEWAAQGKEIDPAAFILRDMADFAIDVVTPDRARMLAELLAYAETDTLCYRADPDEPLAGKQRSTWEPLLAAMEARLGVRFHRISGVIHRAQPAETIEALGHELQGLDAFALAALRNTTSLAASLVIGLAAIEPGADVAALWDAACLEEDWQAELWGKDAEAQEHRARRGTAFAAAARFAKLAQAMA